MILFIRYWLRELMPYKPYKRISKCWDLDCGTYFKGDARLYYECKKCRHERSVDIKNVDFGLLTDQDLDNINPCIGFIGAAIIKRHEEMLSIAIKALQDLTDLSSVATLALTRINALKGEK